MSALAPERRDLAVADRERLAHARARVDGDDLAVHEHGVGRLRARRAARRAIESNSTTSATRVMTSPVHALASSARADTSARARPRASARGQLAAAAAARHNRRSSSEPRLIAMTLRTHVDASLRLLATRCRERADRRRAGRERRCAAVRAASAPSRAVAAEGAGTGGDRRPRPRRPRCRAGPRSAATSASSGCRIYALFLPPPPPAVDLRSRSRSRDLRRDAQARERPALATRGKRRPDQPQGDARRLRLLRPASISRRSTRRRSRACSCARRRICSR